MILIPFPVSDFALQKEVEMLFLISDIYTSSDQAVMEMLGKYRKSEEIYKGTIKKLQENNQSLMEEILNLKETISKFTSQPKP